MRINGITSEQTLQRRPTLVIFWVALFEVMLISKAVLSYWSVPRYPDVIAGNILLAVLAVVPPLAGIYMRRNISWWIELAYLVLFIGYNLYEVTQLLPFAFGELGVYGYFIVAAALSFSVVLAFLSLHRNIFVAVVMAGFEVFYIWTLTHLIRDVSNVTIWFLLMQVVVIFVVFRLLKVISAQHRETKNLLNKQQQLNTQLATSSKRLVEQEKLISIGMMSSELSHEINNPLTFLQGNLMFLQRDFDILVDAVRAPANNRNRERSRAIQEAIDDIEGILHEYKQGFARIGEVIRRLKQFSTHSSQTPHRFNAAEVLSSCVNLHNNLQRTPGIEISLDTEDPLWITGRPADLLTICSTLIENAKEALNDSLNNSENGSSANATVNDLPEGAAENAASADILPKNVLTKNALDGGVSREDVFFEDVFGKEAGQIQLTAQQEDKLFVLSVKDNGPGMVESVQKDITQPFFTTRSSGPNLGLGLATCSSLLQENNGDMRIESQPGEGTTVYIRLPIEEAAKGK